MNLPTQLNSNLTKDSLFKGKLVLYQNKSGYRFSTDSLLLIWFAHCTKRSRHALDIGSGCGVISLGLLSFNVATHVVSVEIQPQLASLCTKNAYENNFQTRTTVVSNCILSKHPALEEKHFDLIVSNPPYWKVDSGRLPPSEEKKIARHEIKLNLEQLAFISRKLLHPKRGRICIAYPAHRVEALISTFASFNLKPTKLLNVYPKPNCTAELVLLEAKLNHHDQTDVLPPLILNTSEGVPTDAYEAILNGSFK